MHRRVYFVLVFGLCTYDILGMSQQLPFNLNHINRGPGSQIFERPAYDQLLQASSLLRTWKSSGKTDQNILYKISLLDDTVLTYLAKQNNKTAQDAHEQIQQWQMTSFAAGQQELHQRFLAAVKECYADECKSHYVDVFTHSLLTRANYQPTIDNASLTGIQGTKIKEYLAYVVRRIEQAEIDIHKKSYHDACIAMDSVFAELETIANQGSLSAQTIGYMHYLAGYAYKKSGYDKRADTHFKHAHEAYVSNSSTNSSNIAYACAYYADMLYRGWGMVEDKVEARLLLCSVMDGNAYNLAHNKALEVTQRLIQEFDDPYLYCLLARCSNEPCTYVEQMLDSLKKNNHGSDDVPKNVIEPLINTLKILDKQGNRKAKRLLGTYYYWYAETINKKNLIKKLDRDIQHIQVTQHFKSAFQYLSEVHDAESYALIARMYVLGHGCTASCVQAYEMLKKITEPDKSNILQRIVDDQLINQLINNIQNNEEKFPSQYVLAYLCTYGEVSPDVVQFTRNIFAQCTNNLDVYRWTIALNARYASKEETYQQVQSLIQYASKRTIAEEYSDICMPLKSWALQADQQALILLGSWLYCCGKQNNNQELFKQAWECFAQVEESNHKVLWYKFNMLLCGHGVRPSAQDTYEILKKIMSNRKSCRDFTTRINKKLDLLLNGIKPYLADATSIQAQYAADIISTLSCYTKKDIPIDIIDAAIHILALQAHAGDVQACACVLPLLVVKKDTAAITNYFEVLVDNLHTVPHDQLQLALQNVDQAMIFVGKDTQGILARFWYLRGLQAKDEKLRTQFFDYAWQICRDSTDLESVWQRALMYACGHGVSRSYQRAYEAICLLDTTEEGRSVLYKNVKQLNTQWYNQCIDNLLQQSDTEIQYAACIIGRFIYVDGTCVTSAERDMVLALLEARAQQEDVGALCLLNALRIRYMPINLDADIHLLTALLKKNLACGKDLPTEWSYVLDALDRIHTHNKLVTTSLGQWHYLCGIAHNDQIALQKAYAYFDQVGHDAWSKWHQVVMALLGQGVEQSGDKAYELIQHMPASKDALVNTLYFFIKSSLNNETIEAIQYATEHPDAKIRACAHYLYASILYVQNEYDQALPYFMAVANSYFKHHSLCNFFTIESIFFTKRTLDDATLASMLPLIRNIGLCSDIDQQYEMDHFFGHYFCDVHLPQLLADNCIKSCYDVVEALLDARGISNNVACKVLQCVENYVLEHLADDIDMLKLFDESSIGKKLEPLLRGKNHDATTCFFLAQIYLKRAEFIKHNNDIVDEFSSGTRKNQEKALKYVECAYAHTDIQDKQRDCIKKTYAHILVSLADSLTCTQPEAEQSSVQVIRNKEALLRKAIKLDKNCTIAMHSLGMSLADINPFLDQVKQGKLKKRIQEGIGLLRQCARSDDPDPVILYTIGMVYMYGIHITDSGQKVILFSRNVQEGIQYLHRAFNAGYTQAALYLGEAYAELYNYSKDEQKKTEYIEQAFIWYGRNPNAHEAMMCIGCLHYDREQYTQALQNFDSIIAMQQQDFEHKKYWRKACWMKGIMTLQGHGVERDDKEALHLLRLACGDHATIDELLGTLEELSLLTISSDIQNVLKQHTNELINKKNLSDEEKEWCYLLGAVCCHIAEIGSPMQDHWFKCVSYAAHEGHVMAQLFLGFSTRFPKQLLAGPQQIYYLGNVLEAIADDPLMESFYVRALSLLEIHSVSGCINAQAHLVADVTRCIKKAENNNNLTDCYTYNDVLAEYLITMHTASSDYIWYIPSDTDDPLSVLMRSGGYGRLKFYAQNALLSVNIQGNACVLLGAAHFIATQNQEQTNNKIKEKHFQLAIEWLEKGWRLYDNQEGPVYLKTTIVKAYCRYAEYLEKMQQYEQAIVYWCKAADLGNAQAICKFANACIINGVRIENGQVNIKAMLEQVLNNANDENIKGEATYLLALYYHKKGLLKRARQYLYQTKKFVLDPIKKQNVEAMLHAIKTGTSLIWAKPQTVNPNAIRAMINKTLQPVISELPPITSPITQCSNESLVGLIKNTREDDTKSPIFLAAITCALTDDCNGLEKLVQQRNVYACASLASAYLFGGYVEQDYDMARYYMLKCLIDTDGITSDGLFWSTFILESYITWLGKLKQDSDQGHEKAADILRLLKNIKNDSNINKEKLREVMEMLRHKLEPRT